MRSLTSISALTILLFSCTQPHPKQVITENQYNWSKDSIRQFFKDSIAYTMYNGRWGLSTTLSNFDTFSHKVLSNIKARNINDPFIMGFDEEYIDTTQIDSNRKWFRITVNPCFRYPYCLILEQTGNKSILTLKVSDGHGGYNSGYLSFLHATRHSDSLYTSVSQQLHQLNFWQLGVDSIAKGLDGETWTFEAIENGQYNMISRWVPTHYGNDTTRQLGAIGITLRKKANFSAYLSLITGRTKQYIDADY